MERYYGMSMDISSPRFEAQSGNGSVLDRVTPDMIHLVNQYWSRYPPLESKMSQILGVFTVAITLMSICGNFMVLYIFGGTKSLRTPANLLVINLAFSDFCMMISQSPIMVINFYYETWILGPLWCDIYAVCGSMFGCISIWSMCMIALDRYNVIVKGVSGRPMTIKLAVLKIFAIWCFATFWTITPLFGWSRYVPEGNLTACTIDYMSRSWNPRTYLIFYSCFVYYTPLLLICYAYWYIIAAVSAHERAMREQAKKMNVRSLRSSEDCEKSAEAKLAKVALTTISLWFMAWTPYLIITYHGLFKIDGLTPLTTIWGATFAKTSAVYNPLVYAISHPKYRIVLKEKCPMCVVGSTDEPKPEGPNSEVQTVSEAESKA
ncbi:opsin Rh2-like [Teleopsis dalmanni]|uniref:opsin Rh2-like n=1 Tax=Teleopsis dalmanni TaxID=139649 RepID=UPI0018CFABDC|nr:opsin Rh2-like [Teleopsis dalmanni]XP_037945615.1 opsin Rh2-like [Teleopsis dalmanni]XP_037945941.1 opsin Rh2-like [Teleopsis dalmanni]